MKGEKSLMVKVVNAAPVSLSDLTPALSDITPLHRPANCSGSVYLGLKLWCGGLFRWNPSR